MATQQISSATSFKNPKLKAIHDVEIDKSGKFKYILIKVHDPDMDREFKYIVRGTSKAGFHGKYTHCRTISKLWRRLHILCCELSYLYLIPVRNVMMELQVCC